MFCYTIFYSGNLETQLAFACNGKVYLPIPYAYANNKSQIRAFEVWEHARDNTQTATNSTVTDLNYEYHLYLIYMSTLNRKHEYTYFDSSLFSIEYPYIGLKNIF